MYYKLGQFFHKVARYFYARVSGVCWNCGTNCGMNSTMARGYLWCNHCYSRWQFVITDPHFVFSIRHFGYPASGLTKRALDVAYECPKCGTALEKDGWCDQHGLPAQPRQ